MKEVAAAGQKQKKLGSPFGARQSLLDDQRGGRTYSIRCICEGRCYVYCQRPSQRSTTKQVGLVMRIKTDISGCPAEEPVPGSALERELFVIENLVAESGTSASHQLTIYNFSPDGTAPPDEPDAMPTAGVIDVSFWEVASADADAESQLLTGFGPPFEGKLTVLATPATGGLALLYSVASAGPESQMSPGSSISAPSPALPEAGI